MVFSHVSLDPDDIQEDVIVVIILLGFQVFVSSPGGLMQLGPFSRPQDEDTFP